MTASDYVTSLAEGFSGQIVTPSDRGYDAARTIHNRLIDKRPALITRCLNTADVIDAVNTARETGLEVSAVR
jgi:hypothetical protein